MDDLFEKVLDKLNDQNYKHYASLAGVESSLVFKWMNGYVQSPRYENLKKLAEALGIT